MPNDVHGHIRVRSGRTREEFGGPPPTRHRDEGQRCRGIRRNLAGALVLAVPVGFAMKAYTGPGGWWVRNYGAGVVYEVFWILLVLLFRPKFSITRVAWGVLVVTCGLEVLQLWHPAFLEAVRRTFLGRALIGTTFSAWDFPSYVLGCLMGAGLARLLIRSRTRRQRA